MPAQTGPDLILFNGVIYTGAGFDADQPQMVEAMAIRQGKVLAIGKTSEVMGLARSNTHLHDLDSSGTGTVVFPGFNDAHTHLGAAGQTRLNLDLAGAKSLDDMLTKIAIFADAQADGHWITGG